MNFLFADVGALSRVVVVAAAFYLVACSAPQQASGPDVFDLSGAELKRRFPKTQTIGVVKLSGARIKTRAYKGAPDELEYLATGGAMLVKNVDSTIVAHAPEILVTPDAAELRGRSMLKRDQRLITGESDETRIVIDGTEVQIEGPHSVSDLSRRKTAVAADLPAPVVSEPAEPAVKKVTAPVSEPVPAAVKKPAPAKKKAVAPKPAAKPESIDRKELLNLMREPSE